MAQATKITVKRFFTKPGAKAYSQLKWVKRNSLINNPITKTTAFEQKDVEFPDDWSQNAINIVAQKYFSGTPDTPEREASLKTLINRVADTITRQGIQEGYFSGGEAEDFREELKYILATQRAAFNSPVWFNIGAAGRTQQASACFILGIEDTMESILNWYAEEGMIFKAGSGSGINLSVLRGSREPLSSSGGTASGPLSFMRGADASAGAIKSGGKTRRAAKMVILNADHPDIEEFIWCKAREERKARVLQQAGYDMDLDGKDSYSVQYQNANNSVRVTDEFMKAVESDSEWNLKAVRDNKIVRTVKARDIFKQFSKAAWECADPGMQFDSTANRWHTTPSAGRINASNPCSEYMHLDNSACNLASINLLKFLKDDNTFEIEAFRHTVEIMFTAQEILVGYSVYPTKSITKNARTYRELGLGYANLGAMLMAQGLPYDSDEGRAQAAAITALMTGHAYSISAKLAKQVGPFAGYQKDRDTVNRIIRMHRDELKRIDVSMAAEELLSAAASAWDEAVELADLHGVRNSQATLLAPTGTIGLMMDCDTTGIEPDLGLVKVKKLVGGGTMSIVNQTVPRALKALGYSRAQVEDIVNYIDIEKTIVGAPHLKGGHLNVFACSMGDNSIHYLGHVKMMAAVQPFLSGAISKTVNMPESATVEDVEQLHIDAWKMGLKAVAIYRDNCKVGQPLSMAKKPGDTKELSTSPSEVANAINEAVIVHTAVRHELPRVRNARTFRFTVAGVRGYAIVGEYDDGTPGELFVNIAKQGSTLRGVMDAFAVSVSFGLQFGVPLKRYVRTFTNTSFAPAGITDDPDIRTASSLIDYIFRRLGKSYLSFDDRVELGLASIEDIPDTQTTLLDDEVVENLSEDESEDKTVVESTRTENTVSARAMSSTGQQANDPAKPLGKQLLQHDPAAPICPNCGNQTQRSGSCYVCTSCGSTTGCS